MRLRKADPATRIKRYSADISTCGFCPISKACTTAPARTVTRHMDEGARQIARDLSHTEKFDVSRRKRKKVEMLFAHLKRNLGFTRFRLRGLRGAKDDLGCQFVRLWPLSRLAAEFFALGTGGCRARLHPFAEQVSLELGDARQKGCHHPTMRRFKLKGHAAHGHDRYPGRLLASGEVIPLKVAGFIAAQIGLRSHDLAGYAETEVTRRRHLIELRAIYGYKMLTGRGARDLKGWLDAEAEAARSNEDLARRFVGECRRTLTILPGISVLERLCADALVAAERRIESRIVERLDAGMRAKFDALLSETVDGGISRFIWLRQFEVGKNSADMNRVLDRLEFLQRLGLSPSALDGVIPPFLI